MKIDNNKKYPIMLSSIAIAVMVAMIALAPMVSQQQQQIIAQQEEEQQPRPGSVLKLSRANVPIDIPLMKGYENGNEIFFIATDASDEKTAAMITNQTGFKANFAAILTQTPEASRNQIYAFTNGIAGNGTFGFQLPVVNAKPGDEGYSPLGQLSLVMWNQGVTARELKSVQEIMTAQQNRELAINKTDIIINHPAIKWEGSSLQIKQDKNVNDDTPYMGGGQVTNIDTQKMIVTMVAHRGWGLDGKTVYYIVTDATPEIPAKMMGVPNVPADEQIVKTAIAPDLFQFNNGINGSGPMGFQAGIGAAGPTDKNYSPMWTISFIEWKDPPQARVLETLDDIAAMQQAGMITITPAMDGKHVVNCPFFEPSTVFEHQSKSTS
jgi:hypothetical protein